MVKRAIIVVVDFEKRRNRKQYFKKYNEPKLAKILNIDILSKISVKIKNKKTVNDRP